MSTLTIELPDDLAARLEAASAQAHVPPAQLVCAALEKALPASDAPTDGSFADRYAAYIGAADDLPADLAQNLDHYVHGHRKQ